MPGENVPKKEVGRTNAADGPDKERLRPWKTGSTDSDSALAEVFNRKDWTIYEGSSSALVHEPLPKPLDQSTADDTDKTETPKFIDFKPPRPYHDEAVYLRHAQVKDHRDNRRTRSRSPAPPCRRHHYNFHSRHGYHSRKNKDCIKVAKPEIPEIDRNGNVIPRPVIPTACCRSDNPRLRIVPPVFISSGSGYGGGTGNGGSGNGRSGRNGIDPCDRLTNVDIIEELKYYTPSGDGPKPEPAYDCYSICNECGEAELVGECPPGCCPPSCCPKPDACPKPKSDSCDPCAKPVTYTRRQRFNFKEADHNSNPDGPPFKWPYDSPNARPTNPYDEIPVGRHQPKEKGRRHSSDSTSSSSSSSSSMQVPKYYKISGKPKMVLPCESGKYFFDADRNSFERQNDEPTKIVISLNENGETTFGPTDGGCGAQGGGCGAQGGGCSAPVQQPCQCQPEEEEFEEQIVEERIVPEQCDVAAMMQNMMTGCGMGGCMPGMGGCMPGMGMGGCMPGMGMGGCMPGMGMGGCAPGMGGCAPGMGGCMPGMGMGGCMPGMGMGGCMPGMAGLGAMCMGSGGGGLGLNGCTLPIMMMPGGTQPMPACGPCGQAVQQPPSCQGSSCASSSTKKHKKHKKKRRSASTAEETTIDFQTESSNASSSIGPSVSVVQPSEPARVVIVREPWKYSQQSAVASASVGEYEEEESAQPSKANVNVNVRNQASARFQVQSEEDCVADESGRPTPTSSTVKGAAQTKTKK